LNRKFNEKAPFGTLLLGFTSLINVSSTDSCMSRNLAEIFSWLGRSVSRETLRFSTKGAKIIKNTGFVSAF
jgi:hypothetical protein